jgi:hypothetical protein
VINRSRYGGGIFPEPERILAAHYLPNYYGWANEFGSAGFMKTLIVGAGALGGVTRGQNAPNPDLLGQILQAGR